MCFDASASPIRNIQRIGRTGRHRAGRVVYILAQGKEMDNYHRNKEVCFFCGVRGCRVCVRLARGAESWLQAIVGEICTNIWGNSKKTQQGNGSHSLWRSGSVLGP